MPLLVLLPASAHLLVQALLYRHLLLLLHHFLLQRLYHQAPPPVHLFLLVHRQVLALALLPLFHQAQALLPLFHLRPLNQRPFLRLPRYPPALPPQPQCRLQLLNQLRCRLQLQFRPLLVPVPAFRPLLVPVPAFRRVLQFRHQHLKVHLFHPARPPLLV